MRTQPTKVGERLTGMPGWTLLLASPVYPGGLATERHRAVLAAVEPPGVGATHAAWYEIFPEGRDAYLIEGDYSLGQFALSDAAEAFAKKARRVAHDIEVLRDRNTGGNDE